MKALLFSRTNKINVVTCFFLNLLSQFSSNISYKLLYTRVQVERTVLIGLFL